MDTPLKCKSVFIVALKYVSLGCRVVIGSMKLRNIGYFPTSIHYMLY